MHKRRLYIYIFVFVYFLLWIHKKIYAQAGIKYGQDTRLPLEQCKLSGTRLRSTSHQASSIVIIIFSCHRGGAVLRLLAQKKQQHLKCGRCAIKIYCRIAGQLAELFFSGTFFPFNNDLVEEKKVRSSQASNQKKNHQTVQDKQAHTKQNQVVLSASSQKLPQRSCAKVSFFCLELSVPIGEENTFWKVAEKKLNDL